MNQATNVQQHNASPLILPEDYYKSLYRDLPPIRTEMEGGRFTGLILINGSIYGQVVSPRDFELKGRYGKYSDIDAKHVADGLANTLAMANDGSEIAMQALEAEINGFKGWHIPARDQLEMEYRLSKPTADKNFAYWRSGDNPSSLPPGARYEPDSPAQTTIEGFRPGEAYAFERDWYLSSTQYSAYDVFVQDFSDGNQYYGTKGLTRRCRLVRRFPVQLIN